ncbi:IS256 family transposase, partial [Veillonella ratti]|nr:IS256 family transposase [Veillonella ratti]MCB5760940.1 IS256 family transposase [Veillonella ratti]
RYTTSAPKTIAGKALYELAKRLFKIQSIDDAYTWIDGLLAWREEFDDFLREMTVDENGNKRATHERLLKAEAGLLRLIRDDTLFTYLTFVDITVPTTNN